MGPTLFFSFATASGIASLSKYSVQRSRRETAVRSLPIQAARSTLSEVGQKKRRQRSKKRERQLLEKPETTELTKIVELLPSNVRKKLQTHPQLNNLVEVVMDLGRVPFARFPNGDYYLAKESVTTDDLQYATAQLGEFGGDNRAGISGTLHRISCIRNRKGTVIGLTARVGRHVGDSSRIIADIVKEGKSILLLGYPGTGKTTAIRSMCKLLADVEKKRVVVVDTSNEIAGDGDVPHIGIGKARRMQVAHPSIQHEVMIEAVENHMPQVIVIDEIGTERECMAARTIAQRGVQLIATAHATELSNLVKNPHLQDLVGGVESVTLGDDEARRRGHQKSVLERAGPPAFDVAIEMTERHCWKVHHDLATAVDVILAGGVPTGEIRSHNQIKRDPPRITQPPTPSVTIRQTSETVLFQGLRRELQSDYSSDLPLVTAPKRPTRRKELSESDIRHHQKEDDDDDIFNEWNCESDWNFFNDSSPSLSKTNDLPASVALRLFLIGIEQQQLNNIVEVLGFEGEIAVTSYLKNAHAVLGLQTEMQKGGWVEKAAHVGGIPTCSLNSRSNMALAKAVQSLLGLSSSTQLPEQRSNVKEREVEYRPSHKLTVEEEAALDEVKLAIEDIIIPRRQPVDLMPQIPRILKQQIELLDSYDLPFETVGEGRHMRIRIYPSDGGIENFADF